ncbi:MAG: hypothetical protein ACUZ8O_09825 [Candidatus Anammoxibacter sp.]
MATGYDGKAISGYQGVFISLREKFEKGDSSVNKGTFTQLKSDLEAFREKNATAGFMDKNPITGASASLGFPPISTAEALALLSKVKMVKID